MKRNKRLFTKKTALLLTASALLLIGSGVGSTRAALTYYSENYSAKIETSKIGVTLMERSAGNDEAVAISSSNYTDKEAEPSRTEGQLLQNMLGENEKFTPGKKYTEELSVKNSGSIDTFVRVIIKKSWKNGEGKNTSLNPAWIELNLTDGSGWQLDSSASTSERMVLYYTKALASGAQTPALSDTIRIHEDIAKKVNKVVDGDKIKYVYDYDGYTFTLDAEVDAVQTHNAQEAIKSAWGVNVTADEQSMSLQ